jgi:hypothetical protein
MGGRLFFATRQAAISFQLQTPQIAEPKRESFIMGLNRGIQFNARRKATVNSVTY